MKSFIAKSKSSHKGGFDKELTINLQITVLQFINTVIERLSSVGHFSSKLHEGVGLCPHKKYPICIATGIETDCVYLPL